MYQIVLGTLVLGTIFEQERNYNKEIVASLYEWNGRISQDSGRFTGYNAITEAKQFVLDKLPPEVHHLIKFEFIQ